MAGATVRIKGLTELNRALALVNSRAAKTVRDELGRSAEPVAATARSKLSRYAGASVGTIGPRTFMGGVAVTQRAGKVSGLRPDFGSLQMREVLIPALEEHGDEIVRDVEFALDRLGNSAGF
jgi:hypothetical protein